MLGFGFFKSINPLLTSSCKEPNISIFGGFFGVQWSYVKMHFVLD